MNSLTGLIGCFSLHGFDLKQAFCTFFNNTNRRCGRKASHFYYHPDNSFVPRCKIHRGLHHSKTKLPRPWTETTLIELQTKQRMEVIEYVMEEK